MGVIERLDAEQTVQAMPELIDVLQDAVDGAASVGFLPPLSIEEAHSYWQYTPDKRLNGKSL